MKTLSEPVTSVPRRPITAATDRSFQQAATSSCGALSMSQYRAILAPATPCARGKLSLGRFSVSRFTPKKRERLHIGSNADRGPNREGPIKTFAIAFVAGAGRDRHVQASRQARCRSLRAAAPSVLCSGAVLWPAFYDKDD